MSETNGRELPDGWEWVRLGDIVAPVTKVRPADQPEKEITYIDISSVDNDRYRITSPKLFRGDQAPSRARQLIRSGDTLLSTVRVYLKNTALVTDQFNGDVASTGFCVIRPAGVHSRYVSYHALTDGFVENLSSKQRGVSYPAVRDSDVFEESIPLAPLPEQHRIVDKIEELFSDLDAGEAALVKTERLLERYRQSVLKAAVEGELTRGWREQNPVAEPAEILLERILQERRARWEADQLAKHEAKGKKPPAGWKNRYKPPVEPDTSDLSELPEGWRWVSLDTLIVSGPQNGLYLPKSLYGAGTPILRIDDYQDDSSRASHQLQKVEATRADVLKYGLTVGDLVINRVNSPTHLGKCLLVEQRNVPALFESNMMRMQFSAEVRAAFVALFLKSWPGRRYLTAGAKWAVNQASINQSDVACTPIPLPPLAEQESIVEEVERRLSVLDAVAAEISNQRRRSKQLRRSILKDAFEGKLVPQDPEDEPAEVLLERIRAKKNWKVPAGKKRGRKAKEGRMSITD